MVIKGKARAGARQLAAHLLRTDQNERAELREVRGVAALDLRGALLEMEAVAAGGRTRRPFYHASINTRADEPLTAEQERQAVDALEATLGLTGQPRAVVAHVKEGRAHLHVVWSRVNADTMKAIPDSHNYRRHEAVSRALERAFGHQRVQGAHVERDGIERPERTPSHAEMMQAERSGMTPAQAKEAVTALWQDTATGQDFADALARAGWILARGDRRDFVLVDEAGELHSLARRVEGVKAKDVRARLSDLDADQLPSADEAREQQAHRRALAELTRTVRDLEAEPEERPRVSDQLPDANSQEAQRQQAERERAALEVMEQQERQRRAFLEAKEREAAEARKAEQEEQERRANDDLADPRTRYARALADKFDLAAPYKSLAAAALAEHARFAEQQEELRQRAAAEQDPEARRLLDLRREIEAADYMALTSNRLAAMGRVITGRDDSPEATRDQERARAYTEQAAELREQRAAIIRERDERQQAQAREQERSASPANANAPEREQQARQAEQERAKKEEELRRRQDEAERRYEESRRERSLKRGRGPPR